MKTTHIHKLTTASFLALALSACCLDKVSLKPKLDSYDIKAAKLGTVNFDVDFQFKDCCPSKEQKALALDLQTKVAKLYTDLIGKPVVTDQDLADYNKKMDAANATIRNVVLVCNALKKAEKDSTPAKAETVSLHLEANRMSLGAAVTHKVTEADLQKAWSDVKKVSDAL